MNLNNVTLPLGLKKCFYIAPKAIFSRYLQCFLHITHPKGYMQHSTKNSKIELPCRKNAFFFTLLHPRRHAQEAIFPVIYSVFFLHLSNTDFDPQKSANHPPQRAVFTVILQCFFHISNTQITLPPPWLLMLDVPGAYVGFCWVVLGLCCPSLGLCWAFLGSMLGHLGSVLAYLGACCAMQQLDSL